MQAVVVEAVMEDALHGAGKSLADTQFRWRCEQAIIDHDSLRVGVVLENPNAATSGPLDRTPTPFGQHHDLAVARGRSDDDRIFDANQHTLEALEGICGIACGVKGLEPRRRDVRLRNLDAARADHVKRGVEAARPILERFGLTEAQKELVLAVIGHHAPSKLRKPDEPWDEFEKRGGLDLLYEGIEGQGENPYPMETVLHYHADILGRRGDETPAAEVERRKHVSNHLLMRYVREHPEPKAPLGAS